MGEAGKPLSLRGVGIIQVFLKVWISIPQERKSDPLNLVSKSYYQFRWMGSLRRAVIGAITDS